MKTCTIARSIRISATVVTIVVTVPGEALAADTAVLVPYSDVLVALYIVVAVALVFRRHYRGAARPTKPSDGAPAAQPSEPERAHTAQSRTPCRARAARPYVQQGRVKPKLGREVHSIRAGIRAGIERTETPSVMAVSENNGKTETFPRDIMIGGKMLINPAVFFVTQTVAAPGERLSVRVAYQAYLAYSDHFRSNAAVSIVQFSQAATALGWMRIKSGDRYFVDRALRLDQPPAQPEQPRSPPAQTEP